MDAFNNMMKHDHGRITLPPMMMRGLEHSRILIIGTSFVHHTVSMVNSLADYVAGRNITVLVSDTLGPHLGRSLPEDISVHELPAWGPLSFELDWKTLEYLRRQKFDRVVLLYHDPSYLGNKRGELVGVLCSQGNIFSHIFREELQCHSRKAFLLHFLFGTLHSSSLARRSFFVYLWGVRFAALFSPTGRRLLFSSCRSRRDGKKPDSMI